MQRITHCLSSLCIFSQNIIWWIWNGLLNMQLINERMVGILSCFSVEKDSYAGSHLTVCAFVLMHYLELNIVMLSIDSVFRWCPEMQLYRFKFTNRSIWVFNLKFTILKIHFDCVLLKLQKPPMQIILIAIAVNFHVWIRNNVFFDNIDWTLLKSNVTEWFCNTPIIPIHFIIPLFDMYWLSLTDKGRV